MAVGVWANTGMGNSLPYPKYLQNIKYDEKTKQLTFEDTFYPNVDCSAIMKFVSIIVPTIANSSNKSTTRST